MITFYLSRDTEKEHPVTIDRTLLGKEANKLFATIPSALDTNEAPLEVTKDNGVQNNLNPLKLDRRPTYTQPPIPLHCNSRASTSNYPSFH